MSQATEELALVDSPFAATEGGYRLQVPLLFATVPRLRPQGVALISEAHEQLQLDLSGVSAADSAGLALLIDWLACARSAGKRLIFLRTPPPLMALAQLSDVAPLLNGAEPAAQNG